MKLIRILLLLMLPFSGFSQIQGEGEVYLTQERIDAKFQGGGIDKFSEFINKEFDYSKVLKAGRMEATFNVDETGSVTKIRITQMLDVESATELIRVLKMCPKWQPATRNGKPISIEIKYPMVFKAKQEPLTVTPQENKPGQDAIYNTAAIETKPDFPGGLKEFYNYVGKNFRIPEQTSGGKIFTTFVIEKDGSVTDIKVLRDVGYGSKEEIIRVLRNCPKWVPGMQSGTPVRVLYSLPITIPSLSGK